MPILLDICIQKSNCYTSEQGITLRSSEVKKTLNPTTWFAQTFDALDGADDTFGTFTPDGQGPPSFPAEGCPCKKKKGKK